MLSFVILYILTIQVVVCLCWYQALLGTWSECCSKKLMLVFLYNTSFLVICSIYCEVNSICTWFLFYSPTLLFGVPLLHDTTMLWWQISEGKVLTIPLPKEFLLCAYWNVRLHGLLSLNFNFSPFCNVLHFFILLKSYTDPPTPLIFHLHLGPAAMIFLFCQNEHKFSMVMYL